MGDELRLMGEASATSLHSSVLAMLHALRTRLSMDAAPYLNQAHAMYPGGVSELDAVVNLLHPPDEDLEVGQVTIFAKDAGEASPPAPPDQPAVEQNKANPPYVVVCDAFPREPTWYHVLPPATQAPCIWAHPQSAPPPLSRIRSAHRRGQPLWQERPGTPLLLLAVATRGSPDWVLAASPTHLHRAAPVLRLPPPGARCAGRGTHLPADPGGRRRQGGRPCAAPPGCCQRSPYAQSPEPRPGLGTVGATRGVNGSPASHLNTDG